MLGGAGPLQAMAGRSDGRREPELKAPGALQVGKGSSMWQSQKAGRDPQMPQVRRGVQEETVKDRSSRGLEGRGL